MLCRVKKEITRLILQFCINNTFDSAKKYAKLGYMSTTNKYTVIDLFSGCGGMSWGLYKSGFKILAGIDNWPIALKTFKKNHPDAKIYNTDIRELNANTIRSELMLLPGELDCLVGGPPCQGFSKNVPAASRFLFDPRNQLFRDFLRFVGEFLPKTVIMENVAEIYNAYNGSVRAEIINELEKLGYMVNVKVLRAYEFGIPQKRRRCFFFASRTGISPIFPTFDNSGNVEDSENDKPIWFVNTAWDAISDLPMLKNGEGENEMEYNNKPQNNYQELLRRNAIKLYNHDAKRLKEKQFARISSLKPGQGLKDLPAPLRPRSGYSGAYGRLDFNMIAPTITRWVFHPGSGRYGHPRDERIITIREAARIQSFSDDFQFLGSYTEKSGQVGNAVPPLIMYALAPYIIACLNKPKATQLFHPIEACLVSA